MDDRNNQLCISRRGLLVGASVLAGSLVLPGIANADSKFPMPTGPDINVLITGDAGTGEAGQRAVATAAKRICQAEGVSLAVGLGDNIYEDGAESADDDEFSTKFEQPNAGIDVPWLMVLGNHDCSGIFAGSGGNPSKGDHEVAYHQRSARWYMPSRYYQVALPAGPEPLVEFFALDTVPVSSTVLQTDPHYQWNGPYMRAQRQWLERALTASRATWKIVLTHHPYRNNGKHGNAGAYDGVTTGDYMSGRHLKELFEEVVCGRADYILSGHDHTSQILDTAGAARGTQQIVCGASAKQGDGSSAVTNKAFWQDFSSLGFMIAKIRRNAVTLEAYTVDAANGTARAAYSHVRPR
ncbi:metallophosphoesterase [Nocardia sp. XZ_19_369]|uniref:metallophosphoesterase n=1 Tax=Nocardia sp. XZ_19_369 TaxID=2769487 RepID=UPI0027D2BD52|nr:metallophosphoesterase [Nocardia sp. XZ_19_369]